MIARPLLLLVVCAFAVLADVSDAAANEAAIISRIPRERVASSAIASIGYSKRLHALEVEFRNGAIYRYVDVPLAVHQDLMAAESKARFYDQHVRGHYRSVRVRTQEPKNAGR
jgi:hypothetical protein